MHFTLKCLDKRQDKRQAWGQETGQENGWGTRDRLWIIKSI